MLSSPSSSLKRRRVESSHENWLESDIALSLASSREARLAWDDDFPEQFELLGKIGEGSFSTVWKARERSNKAGPLFALKRINPTCAPSRILEEYQQMKKLGGRHNVMEVFGLVRTRGGAYAMVMPHLEHDDFRAYIKTLSLGGVAAYMRSLLTALEHVHRNGVIHRDVKPRNFMYSVHRREGLLIDFGLAEPAEKWRTRSRALADHRDRKQIARSRREAMEGGAVPAPVPASVPASAERGACPGEASPPANGEGEARGDKSDRSRLLRKAERGGTAGFRAPEVLWRSRDQEPAVDVWSAGVIFLCLLSRRYPYFPLADHDEMALVHIAGLFGAEEVRKAARESGRVEVTEFPPVARRERLEEACAPLLGGPAVGPEEERMRENALGLLGGMLALHPRERLSAKDALGHPFVSGV